MFYTLALLFWAAPTLLSAQILTSLGQAVPLQTAAPDAYPPPGPCSGNCTSFQDPAIIRRASDGLLHRFGFDSVTKNTVMLTSQHLRGPWTFVVEKVLPNTPDSPWGPSDTPWAPSVYYINGQYFLIYTDVKPKGMGHANFTISYATSPSMDQGSWTDHGPVGIPIGDYTRIGASLLQASNPPQLAFGSLASGVWAVNVTINGSSMQMLNNTSHANNLAASEYIPQTHNYHGGGRKGNGNNHNGTQGNFQWAHPSNGFYYLFFTAGKTAPGKDAPFDERYKVEVCRSSNPYYGYENDFGRSCLTPPHGDTVGKVVLMGHGDLAGFGSVGVLDDEEEGIVLIYEYQQLPYQNNPTWNRTFGWNYLSFDTGWPVLVAARAASPTPSSPAATQGTGSSQGTSSSQNQSVAAGVRGVGWLVVVAFISIGFGIILV